MPVYNAEAYVAEAIRSVLSQTFSDFEFLIINDGSTDQSEAVIRSIPDPRIRYIQNDGNKGLIYTLNRGVTLAQGMLIARMDADDICDPSRFEKQALEFERDPALVLCGSFIRSFGDRNEDVTHMVSTPAEIMAAVFVSCPFAHPTVMMRADALRQLGAVYREEYKHSEDYDLWSRLVFTGKSRNIPEMLLNYRAHAQQVSTVHQDIKYKSVQKIQLNLLSRLGLQPDDFEKQFHLNLFKGISRQDADYLRHGALWLTMFHQAFTAHYPQYATAFNSMISSRWLKICGNSGLGLAGVKLAFKQPFFTAKTLKFKDLIKFFYKTISGYRQVENN